MIVQNPNKLPAGKVDSLLSLPNTSIETDRDLSALAVIFFQQVK